MTGDPTSSEPAAGRPAAPPEGRAAYVISQLYYYVAAIVGVGFVIGGLVAFFFGVRTLVLPAEFQETEDGIRGMLFGLSFALPGLAVVWWHLRQARRREGIVAAGAFWGSVLYFHIVALIALFFVIGGTVGILGSATNALVPDCQQIIADNIDLSHVEIVNKEACYPSPEESARSAIDASIFVIVAAPIMWWHLRQGRRMTAPPPDAVPG